jgi:hypothetical protein
LLWLSWVGLRDELSHLQARKGSVADGSISVPRFPLEEALEYMEGALDRDPSYAPAAAELLPVVALVVAHEVRSAKVLLMELGQAAKFNKQWSEFSVRYLCLLEQAKLSTNSDPNALQWPGVKVRQGAQKGNKLYEMTLDDADRIKEWSERWVSSNPLEMVDFPIAKIRPAVNRV